jgi:hypothetical protein
MNSHEYIYFINFRNMTWNKIFISLARNKFSTKIEEIRKMKMTKSKTKASTIALILVLTIAAFLTFLPTANADNIPTYAALAVAPNPVGVNQQVTIQMWLDKINPTASGPQGSRFEDYTVTITKPNGDQESKGPFTADPASFAYTLYTPDQIGTYTLEFNFPGQQVTGVTTMVPPTTVDDYYEPSSFTTTLTVQENPITALPQIPLPTDYWTRPIDAQNQEWYTISGNWLGIGPTTFGNTWYNMSGNFNPYSRAPRSAHIVWTKPISFGGLIGGEFGGGPASNYYTGKSYEPAFTPPVIINGVLYYNEALPPKNHYNAVDLRTGETIWHHESYGPLTEVGAVGLLGTPSYPGITCGQIFNYKSPNEVGARAYLWFAGSAGPAGAGFGATPFWYMYDAEEGDLILEMDNVTAAGGIRVEGPSGELLYYYIGDNWLALWNSTKAIGTGTQFSTGLWTWRPPTGTKIDWRDGIQWNVTVPAIPGQAISLVGNGMILATTGTFFEPFDWQMEAAYDMETGQQLWVQNRTTPVGITSFGLMGVLKDGVYTEFDKGAMQWRGFSATTGDQIWGPTEAYTNAYGSLPSDSHSAYGNQYSVSVDGIHALNLQTGQRLWDFYADPTGLDYPGFATYPFLAGDLTIADGVVFAPTGNSHGDPLFRGFKLYALDAYSGDEIWSIGGFFLGTQPIADGYLVGQNGYDNQLYCFGKGQTAITVTAPQTSVPKGSTVLIQGSVTDQSPGAEGTPAIADEYMSDWMEYLYMQQPCPMNLNGVPVKLEAFGSDGSYIEIGTVTSDAYGDFKYEWSAPDQGLYTVMATFEGSDSYYSSYDATGLSVGAAAAPSGPIQPEEPTAAPLITTELAIIIAVVVIAVVAIVAYWAIRRRK